MVPRQPPAPHTRVALPAGTPAGGRLRVRPAPPGPVRPRRPRRAPPSPRLSGRRPEAYSSRSPSFETVHFAYNYRPFPPTCQ